MTAFRTILAFAALAGTPAPQKPANAAFHALGDLPGGAFESMAQAISANGSIIVGAAATAAGPQAHRGFRWTPRQGMFELRTHDQPVREALAVSADGSTIVGDRGQHAFRSTAQGTDDLGTLPGRANSRAIAVSADGSVVTGSSYELPAWNTEEAYVCTKTAGMQGLGYLPGEKSSFPNAISPEGSVIADASGAAAFRWCQRSHHRGRRLCRRRRRRRVHLGCRARHEESAEGAGNGMWPQPDGLESRECLRHHA